MNRNFFQQEKAAVVLLCFVAVILIICWSNRAAHDGSNDLTSEAFECLVLSENSESSQTDAKEPVTTSRPQPSSGSPRAQSAGGLSAGEESNEPVEKQKLDGTRLIQPTGSLPPANNVSQPGQMADIDRAVAADRPEAVFRSPDQAEPHPVNATGFAIPEEFPDEPFENPSFEEALTVEPDGSLSGSDAPVVKPGQGTQPDRQTPGQLISFSGKVPEALVPATKSGGVLAPVVNAVQETENKDSESSTEPQGAIGRKDDREKINRLALRQENTSLLKQGQLQFDVGLNHRWQDVQQLVLISGTPAFQDLTLRRWEMPFSVRYGWRKNTELFARLPLGLGQAELVNPLAASRVYDGVVGDLTLGAFRPVYWFGCEEPLTGSLQVSLPTGRDTFDDPAALGSGFFTLSAALTGVESYDPVAIFYQVGYSHAFEREVAGVRVQPGEQLNFGLGLALAVNDDVSLSAQFVGGVSFRQLIDGQEVPNSLSEPFTLRLAYVRRISRKTRIQPFLEFGLNDDARNVNFGFTYSRDFDTTKKKTTKGYE